MPPSEKLVPITPAAGAQPPGACGAIETPSAGADERRIKELRLKGPTGALTVGCGTFVLGRGGTTDVRLDIPELSRVHAVLTVSPLNVTVADLGQCALSAERRWPPR